MSASKEQGPFVGNLLSGKYEVQRHIGHGGMGDVFEGVHLLMERRVAIKIMHARWAATDPSGAISFACTFTRVVCSNLLSMVVITLTVPVFLLVVSIVSSLSPHNAMCTGPVTVSQVWR